jgi:hypothetical protein
MDRSGHRATVAASLPAKRITICTKDSETGRIIIAFDPSPQERTVKSALLLPCAQMTEAIGIDVIDL